MVLDASVIIKWFQNEVDSEHALVFQNFHTSGKEIVSVPDLVFYEIANVFCFKKNLDQVAVDSALDILSKIGPQIFVFSPIELKEVFKFARTYDITVHDAVYAVLAEKLKCDFITADKILHRKLKKFSWAKLL